MNNNKNKISKLSLQIIDNNKNIRHLQNKINNIKDKNKAIEAEIEKLHKQMSMFVPVDEISPEWEKIEKSKSPKSKSPKSPKSKSKSKSKKKNNPFTIVDKNRTIKKV